MQRFAFTILFGAIAVGLAAIAVFAARAGGGAWVVTFAAAALALWMGDLARRAWPRRSQPPRAR